MAYDKVRWWWVGVVTGVGVGVVGAVGNGVGLVDGLRSMGELDAVGTGSVGFAGLVVAAVGGEVAALLGAALGDGVGRPSPAPLPRSGTVSSGLIPGRHSIRYRRLPIPALNAAAAAG